MVHGEFTVNSRWIHGEFTVCDGVKFREILLWFTVSHFRIFRLPASILLDWIVVSDWAVVVAVAYYPQLEYLQFSDFQTLRSSAVYTFSFSDVETFWLSDVQALRLSDFQTLRCSILSEFYIFRVSKFWWLTCSDRPSGLQISIMA